MVTTIGVAVARVTSATWRKGLLGDTRKRHAVDTKTRAAPSRTA